MSMFKTIFAAALLLAAFATTGQAKTYFEQLNESAPKTIFQEIDERAP